MIKDRGIDPGRLVREARSRSGLSQRALADRADTAQSVVARIELGESSPTVGTLNRLLRAAGLEPVVSLSPSRVAVPDSAELSERVRRYFDTLPPEGVASVYLFGSAAEGRMHRESDLDLAVLVDRRHYPSPLNRGELRIRLTSDLIAVSGRNAIDLVILNDAPPLFARAIVSRGTRLICLDTELDHEFVRDIQLRAADLQPFLDRMRTVKLEALAK